MFQEAVVLLGAAAGVVLLSIQLLKHEKDDSTPEVRHEFYCCVRVVVVCSTAG